MTFISDILFGLGILSCVLILILFMDKVLEILGFSPREDRAKKAEARVYQLEQELSERFEQVESLQQILDEIVVACGSMGLQWSDLPGFIRELQGHKKELKDRYR